MSPGQPVGVKATPIGGFNNVDGQLDEGRFVQWLDWIEKLPQATRLRERSYELLGLELGKKVVDAGCGTGKAVDELASRGLSSLGIDRSEKMASVASMRFPRCQFQVAMAEALPLDDASVDGYRAERLYQHLDSPQKALQEARRVLVPGGRIVLIDQDYDTWAIDAESVEQTRTIVRLLSDSIPQKWIGRRYRSLLLEAGFSEVSVEVVTLIYTTHAEVAPALSAFVQPALQSGIVERKMIYGWLEEQNRRGEAGRFFLSLPMFLASAVKGPPRVPHQFIARKDKADGIRTLRIR